MSSRLPRAVDSGQKGVSLVGLLLLATVMSIVAGSVFKMSAQRQHAVRDLERRTEGQLLAENVLESLRAGLGDLSSGQHPVKAGLAGKDCTACVYSATPGAGRVEVLVRIPLPPGRPLLLRGWI